MALRGATVLATALLAATVVLLFLAAVVVVLAQALVLALFTEPREPGGRGLATEGPVAELAQQEPMRQSPGAAAVVVVAQVVAALLAKAVTAWLGLFLSSEKPDARTHH